MIEALLVLIIGFLLVSMLIAILRESTTLFVIDAAMFFIMIVYVRLVDIPYTFITSTDTIVSGSYTFSDVSSSILMLVLAVLNIVLYFIFRIQHSAEDALRKEEDEKT